MAGDNTAETKTYDLSYIATPGLEVTWRSSDEDVATVSGGTITFKRGQWGKAVTITASAVVSEDVTITDSFTVTLTNNVTEFAPSSSMTLAYGNGDEVDTIFASTSATNDAWNNTFAFTAIVNGAKPIAAYRGSAISLRLWTSSSIPTLNSSLSRCGLIPDRRRPIRSTLISAPQSTTTRISTTLTEQE
ncbi:MAG: hypothetical protein ACLUSP_03175 [Christensenellales bacterium]